MKPRILGLVGRAGSGKDTVADLALGMVDGAKIALAGPFKEFAGEVFQFSRDQLWGPSHFRNEDDIRYSFDPAQLKCPIKPSRYDGVKGFFTYILDIISPERVEKLWPTRPFTIEQVHLNRDGIMERYYAHEIAFLQRVLPPGVPLAHGVLVLRGVMERILAMRNITPRAVLQLIGSEFGREISLDIWIDAALRTAQELLRQGKWAIITDVRFVNEARKLSAADAWLLRVLRDVDGQATEAAGIKGHVSELEMWSDEMESFITGVINNRGTLDDLHRFVQHIFSDA